MYLFISGGLFYVLNDRSLNVDVISKSQGIVINATSLQVIGRFHPEDNEFIRPHDMAVSPDGASIYVVELIRSHIRKFILGIQQLLLFISIHCCINNNFNIFFRYR